MCKSVTKPSTRALPTNHSSVNLDEYEGFLDTTIATIQERQQVQEGESGKQLIVKLPEQGFLVHPIGCLNINAGIGER